jgi:hypothetical protein
VTSDRGANIAPFARWYSLNITIVPKLFRLFSKYFVYSQSITLLLKELYVYTQIISLNLNLAAFYSLINIGSSPLTENCDDFVTKW